MDILSPGKLLSNPKINWLDIIEYETDNQIYLSQVSERCAKLF